MLKCIFTHSKYLQNSRPNRMLADRVCHIAAQTRVTIGERLVTKRSPRLDLAPGWPTLILARVAACAFLFYVS